MELNNSWLNGIYTVDNHKVEINTRLPYIAIDGYRIDFFQQGDSAEESIEEIFQTWVNSDDKTIEDSISQFMSQL